MSGQARRDELVLRVQHQQREARDGVELFRRIDEFILESLPIGLRALARGPAVPNDTSSGTFARPSSMQTITTLPTAT